MAGVELIHAAIIGLGWWGKNSVNAAQRGFELSANLADTLSDPRVQAVVPATTHLTR